jgi:hypothetical protein
VVQALERSVEKVGAEVVAQPVRFHQQTTDQTEDCVQDVLRLKMWPPAVISSAAA